MNGLNFLEEVNIGEVEYNMFLKRDIADSLEARLSEVLKKDVRLVVSLNIDILSDNVLTDKERAEAKGIVSTQLKDFSENL